MLHAFPAIGVFVGAGWLIWFAGAVMHHAQNSSFTTPVFSTVDSIFATERLVSFCRAHDLDAIATNEQLVSMLKSEGLHGLWFGIALTGRLNTGEITKSSQFIRPEEMPFQFLNTKAYFATLAGNPPAIPVMRYDKAKIVIIPDHLIHEDPFTVLGDMVEQFRARKAAEPGQD